MIFERKEAHRAPKNNDAAFQTSSLTVSDEIECPDTVDMIETFKEIDLLPPQRKFAFCNPFVCCQNSSSDSDLPEDSDLYRKVDATVSSAYPCHSDSKDILSQDASSGEPNSFLFSFASSFFSFRIHPSSNEC